ncbi:hypothetical protein RB200_19500 [Streptomyces sp. PmtG]
MSNALMPITCQPPPGTHTFRKWLDGESGLPIARILQSAFVVSASAATHSCSGMPHASSRMTSTYRAWMPWNALSSWSAGFRPKATSSSSMCHSVWFTRPASLPRRWVRRMYRHRIARTCAKVGAEVTTKASPGGCVSSHQEATRLAVWDFPAPWQDRTAVRRWSRTLSMISRCFDHTI